MKRLFPALLLLALLLSLSLSPLLAQGNSDLEWVTVDLWPDFDRPSMLVLITGAVAADVTLPATITLPLPQEADLNAVARITDTDELIDDIQFTEQSGTITLTTPSRRFRVEYYAPYNADNLERSYTFSWLAGASTTDLSVSVQQPAAAASLSTDPPAVATGTGLYGLEYHTLPPTSVPAGQSYLVDVEYILNSAQLSTTLLPADQAGAPVAAPQAEEEGFNWAILVAVLGGLLLALAVSWQLWGSRLSAARTPPRKPRAARSTAGSTKARFCHSCGSLARPEDRFCRECGTQLKNR